MERKNVKVLLMVCFFVFMLVLAKSDAANLVGFWDFEDGYNDGANNNDASAMGAGVEIVYDEVLGSNVAKFDGDPSSYLLVANESNFDFDTGFTITAWIKAPGGSAQTDWVNIVNKFGSYDISKAAETNCVTGQISGSFGMINWGTAFNDSWNFIAVTYDGTTISTYLNSSYGSDTNPGAWTIVQNDSPLRIGGNSMASIVGYLDDVRVYDGGLTHTEMLAIYNSKRPQLVAIWDFEDGYNDAAGGNHATAMGAGIEIVYDEDIRSNVASFDGAADSFLLVPNEYNFDFETGFTITAWMKAPGGLAQNDWASIAIKWDSYSLGRQWNADVVAGTISGHIGHINWTTAFDDQWRFVAVSYDGTTITTYVDETYISETNPGTWSIPQTDNPLRIGGNTMSGLVGYLDDVQVYSEGLAYADVMNIYQEKKQAMIDDTPRLIGHWSFDGGDPNDVSGNENHGEIKPAPLGNEFVFDLERGSTVLYLDDTGIDRWIEVANETNFDFTNGVTITAWIKAPSTQVDWVNIITKYDSYTIGKHWNTNYIGGGVSGGAYSINWTTAFDNQWRFIGWSYDANTGISATYNDYTYNPHNLDGSPHTPAPIPQSNSPLRIGGNSMASMVGYLDDVKVYNYALTRGEVLQELCDVAVYDIGVMDCFIDLSDFASFFQQWGYTSEDADVLYADFNGDGFVDLSDLYELMAVWLTNG